MPQVNFSIPPRELGKAPIRVKVKKDGKVFGTLKIAKGSVVWVPADAKHGYEMDWVTFKKIMEEKGKHQS